VGEQDAEAEDADAGETDDEEGEEEAVEEFGKGVVFEEGHFGLGAGRGFGARRKWGFEEWIEGFGRMGWREE
jgi:hypothetical protein